MAATISSRWRAESTARYDKRLGHILRMAARLMARQGYKRTSVRQVVSRAKVALSGLYYYITGKEDLLFRIQSVSDSVPHLRLLGADAKSG